VPYETDLTDRQWRVLEPLLGRGGARGPEPSVDRRRVVNAVLYQAKTGCQWRYLPTEFGNWNTVWRTFARWRDRGVWAEAMDLLRKRVRRRYHRSVNPSMVMLDCQVVKGGRAGPSFHEANGMARLIGAKRAIAVDYLGIPVAAHVMSARRHDVKVGRALLDDLLPRVPRIRTVLCDRGFTGLVGPVYDDHTVEVVIKHKEGRKKGTFEPMHPVWKVEDAFAQLGRWRRLARSFEATPRSATAWLQVACIGYMLSLL
jgi:transposase